jgi:uncharacterized protein (DUF433 family)
MTTRRKKSDVGRIVVDPQVMTGKPVLKGTRVPVEIVLRRLALDLDIDALLADYPRLTRDDVRACVEYAEGLLTNGASSVTRRKAS